MDGETRHAAPRRRRSAPEVIAPSNRVNVALPFSTFRMEEATPELVELASILDQLTSLLEEAEPGPEIHGIRERARALAARLR